ncbi:hypothetical protein ACFWBH_30625, partial [Streptomyces sp. NPDC059999]
QPVPRRDGGPTRSPPPWWRTPTAPGRLGVARQGVQRVANDLVHEDLAAFHTNPDHKGSPLLTLTRNGHRTLEAITTRATCCAA